MGLSILTYTGDGATTQYAVNFVLGILSRDHVKCRVGTEVDGLGDPVYRTLTWINDGLVEVQGTVPAIGEHVVFTRNVPLNTLAHDYSDGAAITEDNLDQSNKQALMAVHELMDGRVPGGFAADFIMNDFKITELGDPTTAQDAVNLRTLEAYTGDAPMWAEVAEDAATAAEGYRDESVVAKDAAIAAQDAAEDARDIAVANAGLIKVTSTDTTPSVLENKVIAGNGVLVTTTDQTGDAKRVIAAAFATQAEAEAGATAARVMSPLRTKQLLTATLATLPQQENDRLAVITVGSQATIDLVSLLTGAYNNYVIDFTNLRMGTDNVQLLLRVSEDNGSTFLSTSIYTWLSQRNVNGGLTPVGQGGVLESQARLIDALGAAATEACNGRITIRGVNDTTFHKYGRCSSDSAATANNEVVNTDTSLRICTTNVINALRLYPSSGNFTGGVIKVYGAN